MLQEINKLEQLINNASNIALFSHVRMDPDTFGSSTTLYYILKKLGKNVILLNDEQAPKQFEYMGANNTITTNGNLKKFNPDLIISLDAASIEQLGVSYKNNIDIIKKTDFIVIDHHITNPGFGDINIIDTNSSSTCELLFEILENIQLKQYIDSKIATLLITGILTDTNVFYNTNVSSKTHFIAGKLLNLGANSRKSIFEFFKKKSINKTKLLGLALSNIEIVKNKLKNGRNIVYTIIEESDYIKTDTDNRDTNGIIEHLINIENTEIAFIIFPIENNINKISIRSHSYDVSQLANKLGGGGHKQASGFSSELKAKQIVEKILDNI